MQEIQESISALYKKWKGRPADSLEMLPPSGSERRYFRLFARLPEGQGNNESVIGTYGANLKENFEVEKLKDREEQKKEHFVIRT